MRRRRQKLRVLNPNLQNPQVLSSDLLRALGVSLRSFEFQQVIPLSCKWSTASGHGNQNLRLVASERPPRSCCHSPRPSTARRGGSSGNPAEWPPVEFSPKSPPKQVLVVSSPEIPKKPGSKCGSWGNYIVLGENGNADRCLKTTTTTDKQMEEFLGLEQQQPTNEGPSKKPTTQMPGTKVPKQTWNPGYFSRDPHDKGPQQEPDPLGIGKAKGARHRLHLQPSSTPDPVAL